MPPKVERTEPPFKQIAERIRTQIKEGELALGAKLPPITQIARDWGVAAATAAKAVKQLQEDGYVVSSSQGTFVGSGPDGTAVVVRLPEQLRKELEQLAETSGRSLPDLLLEAAQDWAAKQCRMASRPENRS